MGGACCCPHREYSKAANSAFSPAKDGPQVPPSASNGGANTPENASQQSQRRLLNGSTSSLTRSRTFIRAKSGAVRPTIELPPNSADEYKIETHRVDSNGSLRSDGGNRCCLFTWCNQGFFPMSTQTSGPVPPTYGSHGSLFADESPPDDAFRLHDFGRCDRDDIDHHRSPRSRSASVASLTEREAAMLAGEDGEDDEICSQFTESSQEYMDEVMSIRGVSPSPLDDRPMTPVTPMHRRRQSSFSASVVEMGNSNGGGRNLNMSREYESEREHKEECPSHSNSSSHSAKANSSSNRPQALPPPRGGGMGGRSSRSPPSSPSPSSSVLDEDEDDDVATFHRPLLNGGGDFGGGRRSRSSAATSKASKAIREETADVESTALSNGRVATAADTFVSELRRRGITTVAFELDQTASRSRCGRALRRDQINTFIDNASCDFRESLPRLFAEGFNLAIATFSDEEIETETVAHGKGKPRGASSSSVDTHIAGRELATSFLDALFDRRLARAVHIVAGAADSELRRSNGRTPANSERLHLERVCAKFDTTPREVHLFSANTESVEAARADGFSCSHVDATHGFRLTDL